MLYSIAIGTKGSEIDILYPIEYSRCGTGFGTVVMAPLVECLLGQFGTKGAMLMTALFSLACCFSGMLMKPIPTLETQIEDEEQQYLLDSGRASSLSRSSK